MLHRATVLIRGLPRIAVHARLPIQSARSAIVTQPALSNLRWAPSVLLHTSRLVRQLDNNNTAAAAEEKEAKVEVSQQTPAAPPKFSEIAALDHNVQLALTRVFKYKTMSTVQEAVLTRLPNEQDIFVKAKTGTGKTLAFLIAALDNALRKTQDPKDYEGASIFIVSPTRELACQIAEEATKLVKYLPWKVGCFIGGDSKRRQLDKLVYSRRCDIIVGTPGRLLDFLNSDRTFYKTAQNTKVLILDEADQLVDMGFKDEIQRILRKLPRQRQTMLFSATLSPEIRQSINQFAFQRNKFDLIDTVGKEDVNTHMHVKQSAIIAPYSEHLYLLQNLLHNYDAAQKGKIIVFLPTTRSTMAYAQLLKFLVQDRIVFELHSNKRQEARSRISQQFKKARPGSILVTSDVSARGVDYPDVSLVLQIGIPSSRETYIHRLGRTGRAGKSGEGILLLAPFEASFVTSEIGDLPVQNLVPPTITDEEKANADKFIKMAIKKLESATVDEIYTAYLGYYSSRMAELGQERSTAVKHGQDFLRSIGYEEIPYLSESFLQRLGLGSPRRGTERRQRSSSSDRMWRGRGDESRRSRDDNSMIRRRRDSFERDSRRGYDDDDNNRRRRNYYDDNSTRRRSYHDDNNTGKKRRDFVREDRTSSMRRRDFE